MEDFATDNIVGTITSLSVQTCNFLFLFLHGTDKYSEIEMDCHGIKSRGRGRLKRNLLLHNCCLYLTSANYTQFISPPQWREENNYTSYLIPHELTGHGCHCSTYKVTFGKSQLVTTQKIFPSLHYLLTTIMTKHKDKKRMSRKSKKLENKRMRSKESNRRSRQVHLYMTKRGINRQCHHIQWG